MSDSDLRLDMLRTRLEPFAHRTRTEDETEPNEWDRTTELVGRARRTAANAWLSGDTADREIGAAARLALAVADRIEQELKGLDRAVVEIESEDRDLAGRD